MHIETDELIPDNSELTLLFMHLQQAVEDRNYPLCVTHIQFHSGLSGPLTKGNERFHQLVMVNMLKASEFHFKSYVNSKGLKKIFSITWQQAKEITKNCSTCSLYN